MFKMGFIINTYSSRDNLLDCVTTGCGPGEVDKETALG